MAYEEEVKLDSYVIPSNYDDAGGVLGGHFETRNAIELCVVCGPVAFLEYNLLHFSWRMNITIAILTLLPLAALCAFGIGGESVSQKLSCILRFNRNRRKLRYISFVSMDEVQDGPHGLLAALSALLAGDIPGFKAAIRKPTYTHTEAEDETEEVADMPNVNQRYKRPMRNPNTSHPATEAQSYVKAKAARPDRQYKQRPQTQNNRWMNSAMAEMLLRKLELGDDEEVDELDD